MNQYAARIHAPTGQAAWPARPVRARVTISSNPPVATHCELAERLPLGQRVAPFILAGAFLAILVS